MGLSTAFHRRAPTKDNMFLVPTALTHQSVSKRDLGICQLLPPREHEFTLPVPPAKSQERGRLRADFNFLSVPSPLDRDSLHGPGYSGTHYLAQAGLKLRDWPT